MTSKILKTLSNQTIHSKHLFRYSPLTFYKKLNSLIKIQMPIYSIIKTLKILTLKSTLTFLTSSLMKSITILHLYLTKENKVNKPKITLFQKTKPFIINLKKNKIYFYTPIIQKLILLFSSSFIKQ
jgi:hypothetical protein